MEQSGRLGETGENSMGIAMGCVKKDLLHDKKSLRHETSERAEKGSTDEYVS